MIISSELTGKTYKTVEECVAAEKEFKLEKEREEKAREKHQKELDKAYEEAIAACNKYLELVGMKINKKEISDVDRLVDDLFRIF